MPDYRNAVIVARHPGAVKRATSYAERLRLSIAVIHGEEKVAESDRDDGRNSPPPQEPAETENDSRSFSLGLEMLPSELFLCHQFVCNGMQADLSCLENCRQFLELDYLSFFYNCVPHQFNVLSTENYFRNLTRVLILFFG